MAVNITVTSLTCVLNTHSPLLRTSGSCPGPFAAGNAALVLFSDNICWPRAGVSNDCRSPMPNRSPAAANHLVPYIVQIPGIIDLVCCAIGKMPAHRWVLARLFFNFPSPSPELPVDDLSGGAGTEISGRAT